jgi:hypothetical protein
MARTRKTEPAVTVSSAVAPAARRKTAAATQKQAAASPKPSPAAAARTKAATIESVKVAYAPKQEAIAELAYSYWVRRGCTGGSPEEDWLRAERELLEPALT